jgi:hypothetical protein
MASNLFRFTVKLAGVDEAKEVLAPSTVRAYSIALESYRRQVGNPTFTALSESIVNHGAENRR